MHLVGLYTYYETHFVYKMYLRVSYDSHTKYRILPYTELTDWCLYVMEIDRVLCAEEIVIISDNYL